MLPASWQAFETQGRGAVVLSENQVRRHSREFVHTLLFIHFVFFRN